MTSPRYPAINDSGSRQVAWWEVHRHVEQRLTQAGRWPTAGTPAWCELLDDDPRKLAALLDAARHWALHLEMRQEASADASKAVAAAEDWSATACNTLQRNAFYATKPWLKRRVS